MTPVTPNPTPGLRPTPKTSWGFLLPSAPAPNKLRVTRDNVRFHDRPHLHRCAILQQSTVLSRRTRAARSSKIRELPGAALGFGRISAILDQTQCSS